MGGAVCETVYIYCFVSVHTYMFRECTCMCLWALCMYVCMWGWSYVCMWGWSLCVYVGMELCVYVGWSYVGMELCVYVGMKLCVPPVTTQNGCAPIHLATCRNHLSIIQYLCECHCNVDIPDKVF